MRVLRRYYWMFCLLGLAVVFGMARGTVSTTQANNPATPNVSKIIIYPNAGETIAQLKQRGITEVDNYGSYWVAEATDQQILDVEKTYRGRVERASHLNRIELATTVVDTTQPENRLQQTDIRGKRLRLIQFKGPIQPKWLEQLRAVGNTRIISYVPNNAYIVWLDAEAENKLADLKDPNGPIKWIGDYHPSYKIASDLYTCSSSAPIQVHVAVVDDPQETLTMRRILALGLVEHSESRGSRVILYMEMLPSVVPQIAQLPAVLWIEKVHPARPLDEVQDLIVASQTNGPGHGPSTSMGITNYLDFLTNSVGGGLLSFFDPATYPVVDVSDTGLDVDGVVQPSFYFLGSPTNASRVAYLAPGNIGYFVGATKDAGCQALNLNFIGTEDFYNHGTRVASIIAGFDTQTNTTNFCIYSTIVTQTFSAMAPCLLPGPNTNIIVFPTTPCTVTITSIVNCTSPNPVTIITNLPTEVIVTQMYDNVHQDPSGFHFGLGISPFGRIGSSRVWRQDADTTGTPPHVRFLPPGQPLVGCMEGFYPVLFNEAYGSGARIQNNSWAHFLDDTGSNGGQYDDNSQIFDTAVRDALLVGTSNSIPGPSPLNQEFIIVFAAASRLTDDGAMGRVGGAGDIRITSPATGKNVITVGTSESVRLDGSGCAGLLNQNNSFDIWQGAQFGPTLDGRFKPEIVAPGTTIYAAKSQLAAVIDPVLGIVPVVSEDPCGDLGLTLSDPALLSCQLTNITQDCVPPTDFVGCSPNVSAGIVTVDGYPLYDCASGSSYAAPAVSGGIQLLWWYFQNRLVNELGTPLFQPSPAMAKAYLCNSARYLPIADPETGARDTLPSIAQGMGELDLLRMFDGVPRVIRDESTPRAIDVALLTTNPAPQQTYFSQTGQSYELTGLVASNGLPLRVTLAWVDAPGVPNALKELVNDLDLQVAIGGVTYKGNVFSEDHSVSGGAFDSVNNMESVFLPAGGAVTSGAPYTVIVRASNIAGDGVPNLGDSLGQDFALVVYNSQTNFATLSDVPNLATNNSCQTAMSITDFPFVFSNNLNTTTYHNVQPSPSASRGGADEFFKIDLPTIGTTFTIDTFGSSFDTVLSVWQVQMVPQTVFVRAPCGALVELVSNDNAGGGRQSQVSFTADGSNTYYVVVEPRNNGAGGTMVFHVQGSSPVSLAPTNLVFGSQFVGTTSAVQTVTFQNSSLVSVDVANVTVGGANPSDFAISENCTGVIPPGSNCTIAVVFTPTANGLRTAQLIVNDDATGGPHTATLSGTGLTPLPAVCGSANALSFGSVTVGFTSAAKSVTITNCGTAALVISNSATITGANAGDFAFSSDLCSGTSIAPGGTCTFGVTFTPSANGARTASLMFSDNAIGSPHSVSLSGTGAAPAPQVCLSTSSLAFGNQEAGTTSSVLSVTVTNCGTANLLINTATITGANAGDFRIVIDGCSGGALVPNAICTIGVVFNPGLTNVANRTASLQIPDNASGSPQAVALSGTAFGSQPDVMISKNRNMKKAIGSGVINNTGANQTLSISIGRNKKKVFYIAFKNAGTIMDAFPVSGGGNVPGQLTVNYYVGAKDYNGIVNEVTAAVLANTYSTSSLAPGAITGDATLLRLQVTIDPNATRGTVYNIPVTARSSLNAAKQDTVVVQVTVH